MQAQRVILASASRARQTLLANAGVDFVVQVAGVDEVGVKNALDAEGATPAQTAETLAELKARKISHRNPEAFVIGADQVLAVGKKRFDKPLDHDHAFAQLTTLAGKAHQLHSAVCVMRAGQYLWHHNAVANLDMRPLTATAIRLYLSKIGARALYNAGSYQLEGLGIQLFSKIEGDYFGILGLPLLPLLSFLRKNDVLQ